MPKNFLSQAYVDHYLQAEIINKLSASDKPLRFSELKENGIENSLFMYHANKLIDRGVIQKKDDGFALTLKGARWANNAGIFNSFQILTPRPLIQFVIQGPEKKVLLSTRRGQLGELLNDFMLPGNIYSYGKDLEENAKEILIEILGDKAEVGHLLTVAEIINKYEDSFVHHVISHIFEVKLDDSNIQLGSNKLFELQWVSLSEITPTNPQFSKSLFLPTFFERLPHIKSQETFSIEN